MVKIVCDRVTVIKKFQSYIIKTWENGYEMSLVLHLPPGCTADRPFPGMECGNNVWFPLLVGDIPYTGQPSPSSPQLFQHSLHTSLSVAYLSMLYKYSVYLLTLIRF